MCVCVVCGMYVWCVGVVYVNVCVMSGIYVWCVGGVCKCLCEFTCGVLCGV